MAKTKYFRWVCGAKFEVRLTKSRKYLQYRKRTTSLDRVLGSKDCWRSAGTVNQALRYIEGEYPYGHIVYGGYFKDPIGMSRLWIEHKACRRVVSRVLKYLEIPLDKPVRSK